MAPFTISPCSISDGPTLGHINVHAFWTDPTWVLIWHGQTAEHVALQGARRMARNLLTDPAHRRHQKAVDVASGAVVGFARWILPSASTQAAAGPHPETLWPEARVPAVSKKRADEAEREYAAAEWSFDDGLAELDRPVTEMKARLMDGKAYLREWGPAGPWTGKVLDHLAVLPGYRGQGVGTMLVESGVRAAEEMGLDVFVLGMKAGLGVYRRVGFELVEQIVQDDSRFGGKGEYGAYFLVREVGKRGL
ncbi:hypothetical protein MMC27_002419 [Xylographa pallens]|nr:hypothetical protein [Xylographa pallens]